MAGVTIASTWDKDALYQRGFMMGNEFKGKGVNIGLLPVCGPLGKNPRGGRYPYPFPFTLSLPSDTFRLIVETGRASHQTPTWQVGR